MSNNVPDPEWKPATGAQPQQIPPASGATSPSQPVDPYAANAAQPQPPIQPAAPAKKKSSLLVRVIAVVALIAVAIGIRVYLRSSSGTSALKVGNCVTVTQNSAKGSDIKSAKADCSAAQSYLVVAEESTSAACGDLPYVEITGSSHRFYCLIENLDQGSCYSEKNPTTYPAVIGATKVDCSASDASFKVEKRADNVADKSLCTSDPEHAYLADRADHKRTYCLVAPS